MNISKSFNRRFLHSCAVFALLAAHAHGAGQLYATDDGLVRAISPSVHARSAREAAQRTISPSVHARRGDQDGIQRAISPLARVQDSIRHPRRSLQVAVASAGDLLAQAANGAAAVVSQAANGAAEVVLDIITDGTPAAVAPRRESEGPILGIPDSARDVLNNVADTLSSAATSAAGTLSSAVTSAAGVASSMLAVPEPTTMQPLMSLEAFVTPIPSATQAVLELHRDVPVGYMALPPAAPESTDDIRAATPDRKKATVARPVERPVTPVAAETEAAAPAPTNDGSVPAPGSVEGTDERPGTPEQKTDDVIIAANAALAVASDLLASIPVRTADSDSTAAMVDEIPVTPVATATAVPATTNDEPTPSAAAEWSLWSAAASATSYALGAPGAVVDGISYTAGAVTSMLPTWSTPAEAPAPPPAATADSSATAAAPTTNPSTEESTPAEAPAPASTATGDSAAAGETPEAAVSAAGAGAPLTWDWSNLSFNSASPVDWYSVFSTWPSAETDPLSTATPDLTWPPAEDTKPAPSGPWTIYDILLRNALQPIMDGAYYLAVATNQLAVKTCVETSRFLWPDCNVLFHKTLEGNRDLFELLSARSQSDPIAKAYAAIAYSVGIGTLQNVDMAKRYAAEALPDLRYWAECGIGDAQIALGQLYEDNLIHVDGTAQGLEFDQLTRLEKAEQFYTAAAQNYPEGTYRLGLYHKRNGNMDPAIEAFEKAAGQSHPYALYELGLAALESKGKFLTAINRQETAENAFRKAATKGLPHAKHQLALMALNKHSPEDKATGERLLKEAVDNGYLPALETAGYLAYQAQKLNDANTHLEKITTAIRKQDETRDFCKRFGSINALQAKAHFGLYLLRKYSGLSGQSSELNHLLQAKELGDIRAAQVLSDSPPEKAKILYDIAQQYHKGMGLPRDLKAAWIAVQESLKAEENGDAAYLGALIRLEMLGELYDKRIPATATVKTYAEDITKLIGIAKRHKPEDLDILELSSTCMDETNITHKGMFIHSINGPSTRQAASVARSPADASDPEHHGLVL